MFILNFFSNEYTSYLHHFNLALRGNDARHALTDISHTMTLICHWQLYKESKKIFKDLLEDV